MQILSLANGGFIAVQSWTCHFNTDMPTAKGGNYLLVHIFCDIGTALTVKKRNSVLSTGDRALFSLTLSVVLTEWQVRAVPCQDLPQHSFRFRPGIFVEKRCFIRIFHGTKKVVDRLSCSITNEINSIHCSALTRATKATLRTLTRLY